MRWHAQSVFLVVSLPVNNIRCRVGDLHHYEIFIVSQSDRTTAAPCSATRGVDNLSAFSCRGFAVTLVAMSETVRQKVDLLHPRVARAIQQHEIDATVLECDPNFADTAMFCQKYDLDPKQACNAIIVATRGDSIKYACCLVLATCKLVNKTILTLLNTKRCSFATEEQTLQSTDMMIGGVTPIGIEGMPIFVDSLVMEIDSIVLGGGNRSSKVLVTPNELLKLPDIKVIESLAVPR